MARKLRRLLLQAVAGTLYYSGLLRLRLFFRRVILGKREVCILVMHRVLSEAEQARANSLEGMVLREATFARMLEFLSRKFRVVSLEDILRGRDNDQGDSRPRCLLTFDDGWRDNYTNAYPLLRRYRFPAMIFLVTGQVGTEGGFWVERLRKTWNNPLLRRQVESIITEILPPQSGRQEVSLEETVEYAKHMPADDRARLLQRLLPLDQSGEQARGLDQMMTWEEAADLGHNGVEMGAHTVTHPLLTHEGTETVRQEVRLSKKAMEENLNFAVRAFAYPNGDWDERVRAEVEQAGFKCAFTTQRKWYGWGGDLFVIPRIMIHEKRVTGVGGKFSPAVFSLTLARWR